VAIEVTPDQESRANDAANIILEELRAAETVGKCEAVSIKHAKTFARLQQVHPARAFHIINLASVRKGDFARAARAKNQQQQDLFL
jgi:hypothetical protein